MRRLLLVNALIFAVLAAVVAFAYFGWSNSSAVALRDDRIRLLTDLAEEKVANIEAVVANADTRAMKEIRLDQLDKLEEQVKSAGAAVASAFVLDDQLKPVLDGSHSFSRDPKDAVATRDWYLANVIGHAKGITAQALAAMPLDTQLVTTSAPTAMAATPTTSHICSRTSAGSSMATSTSW